MDKALIIFSRLPVNRHTKTRLMPYFDEKKCVGLHLSMLKDMSKEIGKLKDIKVFLYYDVPKGVNEEAVRKAFLRLKNIFGERVSYLRQEGKDIGEKMHTAIEEVYKKGYKFLVLTGSDIPELRAADIKSAFINLRYKDYVLGKAADGGYCLIGMKKPDREVFNLEKFGDESVFEGTVNKIKAQNKNISFLRTFRDIDTKEDIIYYRDRLRKSRKFRKSHTGKYLIKTMSIAIIVPVYNEEKTIEALQKQLLKLNDKCEIILVDGGSTDNTRKLIDKRLKLIFSEKGRSRQMNTGALSTKADVLFFLHSDSILPDKPLSQIREVMSRRRAGCFGIAFKSLSPLMFICRLISNSRVFDRGVMFGDQGIFLERDLFFEAGAFPDLPLMEDYKFSLNLKEAGIRFGMTRNRIYTSDRRFKGNVYDKLKLMWKMNRLRKMYRDGIDIDVLANLYKDVR